MVGRWAVVGALWVAACGPRDVASHSNVACEDGFAAEFACDRIDLAARVTPDTLGGERTNDIWGWYDADSETELVLAGMRSGTSVVDISDATNPDVLGFLDTPNRNSFWRDIQVVDGYAYIVSEAVAHGMQVLDLRRVIERPRRKLSADARYEGFGPAHNIVSLAEQQLVWAVGSHVCSGGMYGLDVSSPLDPSFTGCWDEQGYVHDAQCIVYDGPDTQHAGKNICIAATPDGEDFIYVVDWTDPANPVTLGSVSYPTERFSHQGWFTEDRRYFLVNDEEDERPLDNTRTIVLDMSDLDAPVHVGDFFDDTVSVGHDSYIRGDYIFQSNYTDGLRIFELTDLANAELELAGAFDTWPSGDGSRIIGAWGSFPFYPSGNVAVTSDAEGLFVLTPTGLD